MAGEIDIVSVQYCGSLYHVHPGAVMKATGKRAWSVFHENALLTRWAPSRPDAAYHIHDHAALVGTFPDQKAQGLPYEAMVAVLKGI